MSLKGTHCVLIGHDGAPTPRPTLLRNAPANPGHAPNTGTSEGFSPEGRKKSVKAAGYTLLAGSQVMIESGFVGKAGFARQAGNPPKSFTHARNQFSASKSPRTGFALIGRF